MRALILGLGSMGKRRIRNLKALGLQDITGYDTRADRTEYAHDTYAIKILDEFQWGAVSAFDIFRPLRCLTYKRWCSGLRNATTDSG